MDNKFLKSKTSWTVFFVYMIILLVGCSTQNKLTSTPTIIPTAITISPPTKTPIPVVIPTSTNTPISSIFDTLPEGEYLVEQDHSTINCIFKFYSVEGELVAEQSFDECGALSRDGTKLAMTGGEYPDWTLEILDLTTNDVYEIPEALGCMRPSWSPDGKRLAMECKFKEIYVLTLSDKTFSQLTTWSQPFVEDTWSFPAWSPDGQWIAFVNRTDFIRSETDGVYISDVSCLAEPDTCKDKTIGPIFPFDTSFCITWSPDSEFIAFDHLQDAEPFHWEVYTYNLHTDTLQKLIEIPSIIEGLAWSPDGDWVAISFGGSTFLVSPDGVDSKEFSSDAKYISYWIHFPFIEIP